MHHVVPQFSTQEFPAGAVPPSFAEEDVTNLVACLQYNYSTVLGNAYSFFDSQRIGTLPTNHTPAWRGNALTYEADPYGTLQGGFIAGGGPGVVKLSIPIAYATSMLAWSAVKFPQVTLWGICALCG